MIYFFVVKPSLDVKLIIKLGLIFIEIISPKDSGVATFLYFHIDIYTITQKNIDTVENILNNRLRKCLGFKIPLEVFNEE